MLWAFGGVSHQGHRIHRLAFLRCRCFATGGGGGGDEPAGADGCLLHPTATIEKNGKDSNVSVGVAPLLVVN